MHFSFLIRNTQSINYDSTINMNWLIKRSGDTFIAFNIILYRKQ